MWFRVLSTSLEEELEVLDFVLWLNHNSVLLDCFPLFLHFSISLIKFALWNLGKAKEAKGFLFFLIKKRWGDIRVGGSVPRKAWYQSHWQSNANLDLGLSSS